MKRVWGSLETRLLSKTSGVLNLPSVIVTGPASWRSETRARITVGSGLPMR